MTKGLGRIVVRWSRLGLATLLAGCASPANPGCVLSHVDVTPVRPGDFSRYVGRGKRIELTFTNERPQEDVNAFPEPPIEIRDTATGRGCDIEDGGIWRRDTVFLGADEQMLVVLEFSGSNDWLAFFDTTSCARVGEVDVSIARWEVGAERIKVGTSCSGTEVATCANQRIISLDDRCRPLQ